MRYRRNDCCQEIRYKEKNILLLSAILMVATLIPTPVLAKPDDGNYHFILNGRSIHLSRANNGQTFNDNNLGSGFQYDYNTGYKNEWVSYINGSIFNDSLNNASYYLGSGKARRYPLKKGWRFDVGYLAFIMARKDYKDYDPFLGILPVVSIGTRRVAMNMTYIPRVNERLSELIFLQLKISTKGW